MVLQRALDSKAAWTHTRLHIMYLADNPKRTIDKYNTSWASGYCICLGNPPILLVPATARIAESDYRV